MSENTNQSTLIFVLGTRPEIIKLAPVIRECERRDVVYSVIHTGQHYSDELDSVFFDQLELPTPDYNLRVGSKSHGKQTGEMLIGIEEILFDEQPESVLVQGDTNSVLAGGLATSKLDMTLGHVEAGLRSFDREMPEETNRVIIDHIGDILFAPTEQSKTCLCEEGIPEDRIFVTGNTVVDAVKENATIARKKSTVLHDLGLGSDSFGLMTAHRAENVDNQGRFASILQGAGLVSDDLGIPIVYPIHPRAREKLTEFDLVIPRDVRLVDSQSYLDFLHLQSEASVILTDSGGVQEEACVLGTPCVTLRDNTERPETVDVGANKLAGTNPETILDRTKSMYTKPVDWENPLGDGTAADQILDCLGQAHTQEVSL